MKGDAYPYGRPGMFDHALEQAFYIVCLLAIVVPWWAGFYYLGTVVGAW